MTPRKSITPGVSITDNHEYRYYVFKSVRSLALKLTARYPEDADIKELYFAVNNAESIMRKLGVAMV